ncbi:MAG: C/D box methylation guide ribonucleoprotein complex aNOP56 subunit [Candidatus Korarchaeota archaeon NZ13-K]|nr:MAG: C/D box methylation guide ribonucleoprotein complex aNOP56 subunit [Candidatus Korarchaeota archaeon NZ13-K]
MRAFIALQPFGLIALDERGELLEGLPFPRDAEAISNLVRDREFLRRSLKELMGRINADEIVVNDARLKELLDEMGVHASLSPGERPFSSLRRSPLRYASQLWGDLKQRDYLSLLNEIGILVTRARVREQLSSLDQQVIKAVDFVDHSNKALNMIAPTIREWYSVHFPELNEILEDHYDFIKLVSIEPDRNKMREDALRRAGFSDKMISKIIEASRNSMGADLSEVDLQSIKSAASSWIALYEARRAMESYIEDLMRRAAPNLSAVVHPLVGARLIAIAGSLERLANLPASSIQILGAHKAIFMHLTKGTKPPKHGVIFQAKEIRSAPKSLRGKIARLLATKIAIAARVDFYGGGKYIGDQLRREIDEKIKRYTEAMSGEG